MSSIDTEGPTANPPPYGPNVDAEIHLFEDLRAAPCGRIPFDYKDPLSGKILAEEAKFYAAAGKSYIIAEIAILYAPAKDAKAPVATKSSMPMTEDLPGDDHHAVRSSSVATKEGSVVSETKNFYFDARNINKRMFRKIGPEEPSQFIFRRWFSFREPTGTPETGKEFVHPVRYYVVVDERGMGYGVDDDLAVRDEEDEKGGSEESRARQVAPATLVDGGEEGGGEVRAREAFSAVQMDRFAEMLDGGEKVAKAGRGGSPSSDADAEAEPLRHPPTLDFQKDVPQSPQFSFMIKETRIN